MKTEIIQDNKRLLLGIKEDDTSVIKEIFLRFQAPVCAYLIKKGATNPDAQDVFMDALEAIYRKLLADNLTIERSSFQTYLTSICINQWYKKCRRKSRDVEVTPEELNVLKSSEDLEDQLFKSERATIFWDQFYQLAEECQKVLKMALIEETSLQEVAEKMGYSYQYARKKKSRCHKGLVERIKEDERFIELNA